jgi:hypothetical protein
MQGEGRGEGCWSLLVVGGGDRHFCLSASDNGEDGGLPQMAKQCLFHKILLLFTFNTLHFRTYPTLTVVLVWREYYLLTEPRGSTPCLPPQ